jgi:hypothetical protein
MIDKAMMGTMMGPPLIMSEMNILHLLPCLLSLVQAQSRLPAAGRDEKIGQSKLPYFKIKVPGPGIEPGTRGFSVLCSTD